MTQKNLKCSCCGDEDHITDGAFELVTSSPPQVTIWVVCGWCLCDLRGGDPVSMAKALDAFISHLNQCVRASSAAATALRLLAAPARGNA
jgi:hypothetical protein